MFAMRHQQISTQMADPEFYENLATRYHCPHKSQIWCFSSNIHIYIYTRYFNYKQCLHFLGTLWVCILLDWLRPIYMSKQKRLPERCSMDSLITSLRLNMSLTKWLYVNILVCTKEFNNI